jgi:hypothetical protein
LRQIECFNHPVEEVSMRWVPNLLVILATLGLVVGLGIRLVKGGFLADQIFFWRGSLALLVLAIAVTLIQIRNK